MNEREHSQLCRELTYTPAPAAETSGPVRSQLQACVDRLPQMSADEDTAKIQSQHYLCIQSNRRRFGAVL